MRGQLPSQHIRTASGPAGNRVSPGRTASGIIATAGFGIANTADKAKLEKSFPKQPGYSPYAGRNFPNRPLFGDTHLHTGFSLDAGASGARLTPRVSGRT